MDGRSTIGPAVRTCAGAVEKKSIPAFAGSFVKHRMIKDEGFRSQFIDACLTGLSNVTHQACQYLIATLSRCLLDPIIFWIYTTRGVLDGNL